ncbi:hydantoinase B/oxoprolinase family protein [Natranaerofaba carboxydovora]|uniref:hydantoinase B/oxoprolinase family protein n=1 Tax=Natranaerofaba carboxydovora TaxID=2742683 RepID=UPI001F1456FF|nr:hydantoinase B/oxoprolinase family protein [Natranaerofaba carboxydovora]UMZ74172.1 Acetophenone carboxylase delta subunit [Natranaerofaba carboxydovora]
MVEDIKNVQDPVTLEVMRNALQSIAEEMGVTLIRTALSPNIKDRRDCSTAIYTADGDLVAQAEHIPLHLGLMPTVIKEVLKHYPKDNLEPGDAIIINDPYISGSHLPDVCIFSPVFSSSGSLFAIVANLAHHVDIGGISAGGMPVNASEIFQEGVRIPPLKIRKKGEVDKEILKLIENNVRTPFELRGDLEAQLAASNVGSKRLVELEEKYGEKFMAQIMEELINYAKRRMRNKIRELENGEYSFADYLELSGENSKNREDSDDKLLPIKVNIKINDENIFVDFTGTSKQVDASLNSTFAVTLASVYYGTKSMIDPDVPPNEGAFKSIEVTAPRGTIVNPNFPAPVSNANINTSQRIADVVLGALAKALPDRAMAACSGTMSLLTLGGIDPRVGQYYSYVETYGGGMGAVNGSDGMDGVHTNMTNTLNTPTEVIEISYPLLVEGYGLLPDTEGPGKYRGGMGLYRRIKILEHETNATLSTERGIKKPWGLFGGKPGSNSVNILESSNGAKKRLPTQITTRISPKNVIDYQTPGAGGYGDPYKRDPQKVLKDVKEGLVSVERAKKEYGVVICQKTLTIDYEGTAKIREL